MTETDVDIKPTDEFVVTGEQLELLQQIIMKGIAGEKLTPEAQSDSAKTLW